MVSSLSRAFPRRSVIGLRLRGQKKESVAGDVTLFSGSQLLELISPAGAAAAAAPIDRKSVV